MKLLRILTVILHLFVGIGALAGGLACIVDPINPLGAPSSMLEGSPFSSFLIPGLVLFILFGIGNLVQLIFMWKKVWWRSLGEGILGGGMIIWIVVQVLVIESIVFLHIAFLAIGTIQAATALHWFIKDHTLGHAARLIEGIRYKPQPSDHS